MTAYYNEIEPFAAESLKIFIDAGLIPQGDVDTRSITEVQPHEIEKYTQCHFFAGIGGWAYAARLAGWPDDRPLWTGSCPCQPFSVAGESKGFDDERDLWPAWFRLIRDRRPPVVMGEQVTSTSAKIWWDRAANDLEGIYYAGRAVDIPAVAVGAKQIRHRLWFIASPQWDEQSRQKPCCGASGRMGGVQQSVPWNEPWESALSRFRILGDGLPRSVGATDAARNAIVPQVAAEVIGAYMDDEQERKGP